MTILSILLINKIRTGGDRDYLELLELLAKRGNKVFVIMNSFLKYEVNYISPVYLSIKYVRHRFPPASYLFKYSIKKYLRKIISNFHNNFPDIIHIHGDIYLKSAIYLKKKLNIPFFYASRLNDISKAIILRKYKAFSKLEYIFSLIYEQVNRYREKQIAYYSDLICFLNPFDRDIFLSRTKRSKKNVIVIPNNIGLPRFTEETRNKNNSKTISRIVYVGSLSANKGIWDLIKAAGILKAKGYNLFYHILARIEDEKNTFSLIEKLDLKNFISIEGFVSPFPFFISCDLFIYPTLYDDWGNVITEALHCGCPVIASNSTGPAYILEYNELLFNMGKPDEIADKIIRCIDNNDYYLRIRKLCSERTEIFHFNLAERFENAMSDYLCRRSVK